MVLRGTMCKRVTITRLMVVHRPGSHRLGCLHRVRGDEGGRSVGERLEHVTALVELRGSSRLSSFLSIVDLVRMLERLDLGAPSSHSLKLFDL